MAGHTGHRQRVKAEFAAAGLEGWPEHRVLELILFYAIPQGDVNELAHALIERFGNLAGVLDASPDELRKVKGVGEHTIGLLKLFPAVGRRYMAQRSSMERIIRGPEEAGTVLAPYFYAARNEMSYILCMDGKCKLLGVRKVADGSIYAADINIRRIAEEALGLRAAKLYLAHNHISNLAFPSSADWQATDTVRNALFNVGLELVDHLIFVDGDMVSLNQSQRGKRRPIYELI